LDFASQKCRAPDLLISAHARKIETPDSTSRTG